MRFVDISVERFGVLRNSELRDLSPGLTVVSGGNGSGKTTMINFLRGVLFGYTTDHQAFQPSDSRFGGSISMESHGQSYRLTRERNGISSDLSKVNLGTGVSQSAASNEMPAWINETVHREIFSVGDQEAARFDLLTRLCLDGAGQSGTEDEIRKAELAIEQCTREREGNGVEGGLRQNISGLTFRKDELTRKLTEMRRVNPEIPVRIAEVEAELLRLQSAMLAIEQQIGDITAEIRRLEELLEVLRRRNVVALDRQKIEAQISQLTARQDRWSEIRRSVQRELSQLNASSANGMQPGDSLRSIRALVSRLEQRMDSLQHEGAGLTPPLDGVNRDIFVDHIRNEVFSLCDYVTQHETAIESHEASLEALLGQRTLNDVENVETVLQGRIDAHSEELVRCEDILRDSGAIGLNCESGSHAEHRRFSNTSHGIHGSVEEVEAELSRLRRRQHDLQSELRNLTDTIARFQKELIELKGQLRSSARLEDIDRVQAEIASIDAQLSLLRERWNVLERTEGHLRSTIERLRDYRIPGVLELASRYTDRLTGGDCYQLVADAANSEILAQTRQASQPMRISQLSRGTRDQVALALRLALISHRAEDAERCPLILDDVFITSDDDRAAAVADLLMEIAHNGQQIIFFTCQNDVKELFARRDASIRYLDEQPIATPVAIETSVTFTPPATLPQQPVLSPPVLPPPAIPETIVNENTNWLYYLEVDNSVEDLSGLTVAEVEAFRASKIETIDELLTLSVDELERRFHDRGYSIGRERIRAWRGQAELATQIPMLRRSDAELLYAAGIHSTVELSRMRPETVFDMVSGFQETQVGARYRRSGRNIDRQQSINWSRWSQHARSLSDARRSRSRYFVNTSDSNSSNNSSAARSSESQSNVSRTRRARITGSQGSQSVRRQPRPSLTSEDERRRRARQSQRRERLARHSSSYRTNAGSGESSEATTLRELKFYLNPSDDVEAAPSIGPKTAQRLAKAGVYTVEDLLTSNADSVATKLANRRISVDTILQWQAQARLVCLVPELRGHDAQILVACGITDPEELAQKRPVDLFAVVGPFADTSEGERIVRGGRKPDLEEVTDWISWAQQSRSMKSAA